MKLPKIFGIRNVAARNEDELEATQQPKKIDYPFLTKQNFLGQTVVVKPEELVKQQPILFYMTEEKNIFAYPKQKTGLLQPKDHEGKERTVRNEILGRKQCRLHYGKIPITCYVHYEMEHYGYPHEPIKDAEEDEKIIKGVQRNYEAFEEAKKGINSLSEKKLMTIIKVVAISLGVIIAAIWLVQKFLLDGDTTPGQVIVQNGTEIIKQNLTRVDF